MLIYIETPEHFTEVLEKQIKPYYNLSDNPRFALDFETWSLMDPANEDLYKVPRPIPISPRWVSNIRTKQSFLMEYEGYVATMQLGADPRVCDMQWIFDIKKLGEKFVGQALKPILENAFILGHNLKYELSFLMRQFDIWLDPEKMRDTQLIDQILISGRKDQTGLDDNYRRYLDFGWFISDTGKDFDLYESHKKTMQKSDWAGDISEEQLQYAADDVRLIHFLYEKQKEKLKTHVKRYPRSKVLDIIKMECRLIPEVCLMEMRGVQFDMDYHMREVIPYLEKKYEEEYARAAFFFPSFGKYKAKGRGKNRQMIRETINFNSAQQVVAALASLGIDVPNSQEDTLKAVRHKHPAVEFILRCRKARFLLNNFGNKLPRFVHEDGKIYPNFRQIGTETGRFSSNHPNMQQIPAREMLFGEINSGELFRKAFIASLYHVLVDSDFSNIEPRIIAQVTQCLNLIQAFIDGVDYHGFTAKILMDLPEIPKKKTHEREVIGKIGNLSLGYCAGWPRLKENMYIYTLDSDHPVIWTDDEAKAKHEKYFEALPEVKVKIDSVRKMVEDALQNHDSLEDFAGRKPIFTIHTENLRRHRSFYLTEKQEGLSRHKVKGDPRDHPLHKWHKVTREYKDPKTGQMVIKDTFYNEFWKTVSNIAREAYNYLIQGEAANILKLSMLNLNYKKLIELGFDIFKEGLILTVHDELVFQAEESRKDLAMKIVEEAMVEAGKVVINLLPVKADPGAANNWAEAKT